MSRGSGNMSGSNTVPLGSAGRIGSGGGGPTGNSLLNPSYLSQPPPSSMPNMPPIRNYDMPNMPNRDFPNMPNQTAMVSFGQVDRAERKRTADKREGRPETKESREDRKKKRKSRWTDEACKTFIPGLPTMIPGGLSKEQEEAYLCKYFISFY